MRGPFRGGMFYGNPRASMRKVLGLYEHELNPWLKQALPVVTGLLDLGGNDGYFTFGCAAAFARRSEPAHIVSFEPDPIYSAMLAEGVRRTRHTDVDIAVVPQFVGGSSADAVTLDSVPQSVVGPQARALIKVDVEGAELEVLQSAGHWLDKRNLFLIEVHAERLLAPIVALLAAHGVSLRTIEQQPHWLLGREQRERDNRWLVSALT